MAEKKKVGKGASSPSPNWPPYATQSIGGPPVGAPPMGAMPSMSGLNLPGMGGPPDAGGASMPPPPMSKPPAPMPMHKKRHPKKTSRKPAAALAKAGMGQDSKKVGTGHASHPGFAAVQAKIAKKEGVSGKAAGAILANSTRKASPAAKKANPSLKKVH